MTVSNKRYPGRPNYTGPKSGFFLLPFHADLVMWMPDIFARLETIDKTKPTNEIAWRRHCMAYVRSNELPLEVTAACVAVEKANAARWRTNAPYGELNAAYSKARSLWWKVFSIHKKQLTALLTKYVPDHTWNGKELVFK